MTVHFGGSVCIEFEAAYYEKELQWGAAVRLLVVLDFITVLQTGVIATSLPSS